MYTSRDESAGIKLTDFGLALLYPGASTSLKDDNLVGTPGYGKHCDSLEERFAVDPSCSGPEATYLGDCVVVRSCFRRCSIATPKLRP